MMNRTIGALCFVLWALLRSAPVAAAPTLEFTASSVTVNDVTAGSEVAWIVATRQLDGFAPVLYQGAAASRDEDGDGEARFPLPQIRQGDRFEIPPISLWAAVDVTSGEVALATPSGGEPRWMASPLRALLANRDGEVDLIEIDSRLYQTLLVRPGVGAWEMLTADGSEVDADRELDGILTLQVAALRPLGASQRAPRTLAPGDLLLFVAPETLEAVVLPLTSADLGGEDK